MKWPKSRGHRTDYYAWQDLLHVMFVTLVICLVVALVIALLLIIMNPRVATAGDITNWRTARRLAAPTVVATTLEKVTTRASVPIKVLYMEISAYSPSVNECDGNPTRTASGKRVYIGGIAADLRVLPFGSRVIIPNYNGGKPCTVVDTGGSIRGNKLDIFLWSSHEAIHFGRRRNVKVQVLYIPKAQP